MRSSPRMPIIISPMLRMCLVSAVLAGVFALPFPERAIATVTPATSLAQAIPSPTPTPTATTPQAQLEQAWQKHQLLLIAGAGVLSLYLIILWGQPQLLLKIPSADIEIPGAKWKFPMSWVRWLKYRDRVLDTWVEQYWKVTKEAFDNLPTVKERQIHIDLPVRLDSELIPELTAKKLVPIFRKNSVLVLITAEGGGGKTSLACQIARWGLEKQIKAHRMLPVLIETELDEKKTLLEAIRGQLTSLTDQPEAIADLGNRLGPSARMAVPYLLGMTESRNQEPEVRQLAIATLAKLARGTDTLQTEISDRLLTLLHDPTEDPNIRRSVAEALGEMKTGKAQLLELLHNDRTPLTLRQGAARAIRLIGGSNGEAIPMLMVELREEAAIAQVKSIPVWKEPLDEDLTLDLVAIPGGEFLMGSPPDEVGRDWYPQSYPDTEGLDGEAQHEVKVQPFWMSQFPITQAQWRAIALLPKVNRDLDPDPANFKGDRHPIETVSWYDAMEFCARLSQHTGKTYRLPSEAEWEYACRAGTTTPFHFGETLGVAIANYDGRYTYGEGSAGDFRNQTIEVGSFGVVNAFGLAEMHGTVWEWCLDHWHPSYEGAPTDGSAWVTDGNDRFRLLRGGSWLNLPGFCRSAYRYFIPPDFRGNDFGFRLVCVSPWT